MLDGCHVAVRYHPSKPPSAIGPICTAWFISSPMPAEVGPVRMHALLSHYCRGWQIPQVGLSSGREAQPLLRENRGGPSRAAAEIIATH